MRLKTKEYNKKHRHKQKPFYFNLDNFDFNLVNFNSFNSILKILNLIMIILIE